MEPHFSSHAMITKLDQLFTPLQLGDTLLNHRVIMAPLTRYRAPNCIAGDLMEVYYSQRASKGGLLIAGSNSISATCGLPTNNPRIDTAEAIEGWKKVVDAVHAKEGFFFCQINHYGRASVDTNHPVLSSSGIKLSGKRADGSDFLTPKEMTVEDMNAVIEDFVQAADNAINKSGFDGVEIHGANGYLIDQFLEDNINVRTDEFGGSIENRAKFPLAIVDAVVAKVGAGKVGFRISPWDAFQDANDSNPEEHFAYVCEQLEKRKLAYVHVVEARSDANGGRENDKAGTELQVESSVAIFRSQLPTTPLLSAGGWNDTNSFGALQSNQLDGLVYGRYFISNPDLPKRLRNNLPLTKYDRSTFYEHLQPKGYIDYPFADE